MKNVENRHRAWIKIIAVVIVCLFTINNITWANPDIFQRGAANVYLGAASNFWEPSNLFSVQVALQVYLRGLHKPFEKITEHLFPEVNGEKVHLFFDSSEKRQDETGKWIIPGKKDFIEFEAVIDPENDFDATIRKKDERPAESKHAEPESKPEIDEKTAEEGKTGDGFIHQGELSAKKFEAAPKEDITDEYLERLAGILEEVLLRAGFCGLSSREQTKLKALLEKIKKSGYKVFGFKSIVEGRDDFHLGRHFRGKRQIYIAADVISALESQDTPSLADEYLFHELICPVFGHERSIELQQKLFPDHYRADGNETVFELNYIKYVYTGDEDGGKKIYKGILGKNLRNIINNSMPKERSANPVEDFFVIAGMIVFMVLGAGIVWLLIRHGIKDAKRREEEAAVKRQEEEKKNAEINALAEKIRNLDTAVLASRVNFVFGKVDKDADDYESLLLRDYIALELQDTLKEAIDNPYSIFERRGPEGEKYRAAYEEKLKEIMQMPEVDPMHDRIMRAKTRKERLALFLSILENISRASRSFAVLGKGDKQDLRKVLDRCYPQFPEDYPELSRKLYAFLCGSALNGYDFKESVKMAAAEINALLVGEGFFLNPTDFNKNFQRWLYKISHAFEFKGHRTFLLKRFKECMQLTAFGVAETGDEYTGIVYFKELATTARKHTAIVRGEEEYSRDIQDGYDFGDNQERFNAEMTRLLKKAVAQNPGMESAPVMAAHTMFATTIHEHTHLLDDRPRENGYDAEVVTRLVELAYADPYLEFETMAFWMMQGDFSIFYHVIAPVLGIDLEKEQLQTKFQRAASILNAITQFVNTDKDEIQRGAKEQLRRKFPEIYEAWESEQGILVREKLLKDLIELNKAELYLNPVQPGEKVKPEPVQAGSITDLSAGLVGAAIVGKIMDQTPITKRNFLSFGLLPEKAATPTGFIHQGKLSEKKFEAAPKEDITDGYKERLVSLLEKFTQGVSPFSLAPEHRRALEELIEKVESGGYTIYGFKSIVEGEDDFFLGRHYPGDKEIFLATDFIAELENMCRPHLIDEYLLHELICPTLGHYYAILAQQEFFPDNYPAQGLSKGLLGAALRIFINQKVPAKEKKSGPGKGILGLILAVIGGSFLAGCTTTGTSIIGGLPIVVILLAVLIPSILNICDRMYYLDELRREKEREDVQNEEEADRIAEEIEKAVEEMGDELDELADALEDEGEDDLETEVSDEEKHDIREVTIKTVVRYLRSDKKDKNFEEVMGAVIQAIQQKVLVQDNPAAIGRVLRSDRGRGALERIYEKAGKEITPGEEGDKPDGTDGAAQQTTGSILAQKLAHLKQHLSGHHHHHMLWWIGIGAYFTLKYGFGITLDPGVNAMTAGIMPLEWMFLAGIIAAPVLILLKLGESASAGAQGQGQADPDYIKQYTNGLDELAEDGKIDDTYYVANYAAFLNDQITDPEMNNVMIVGDPIACQGLIEGIVVRKGETSTGLDNLRKAKFFEINTARFAENLAIPGQLETELAKLTSALKAARKGERSVLVLNFQDFYDVQKMKSGMMASLYFQLKEAIENENISVVILGNPQLYDTVLAKDKRLEPKFSVLDMRAPPEYDLLRIAKSFTRRINSAYKDIIPEGVKVQVPRKILDEALRLSQKHYPQGLSVNKLQEVIDKIITRAFTAASRLEAKRADIMERILRTSRELVKCGADEKTAEQQKFLELSLDRLLSEQEAVEKELEENRQFIEDITKNKKWEITIETIAKQISEDSGVPLYEILASEDELLKDYVPKLQGMLIGQDKAINDSYQAFSRRRVIGASGNLPIGAFLLVGPTGVGKTEFARSLARHMFGSEDAMVRIDMSEYMNQSDSYKLIGSPPGYVGYEEGGQLTNHVLKRPYSVVLLDEVEKAHPKTLDLLLQVLNNGELRDGKGRMANFRNTIIIMTSNIGFSEGYASDPERTRALNEKYVNIALLKDIGSEEASVEVEKLRREVRKEVIAAVKAGLRPELIGRIGLPNIINFNPLSKEDLEKILDIKLKNVNKLLFTEGYGELRLSKELREKVLAEGYDVTNGARPLERALKRIVLAPLADLILADSINKGETIEAGVSDGKATFKTKKEKQETEQARHRKAIDRLKKEGTTKTPFWGLYEMLGINNISARTWERSLPGPKKEDREAMEALQKAQKKRRERLEIDIPEPESLPGMDISPENIDTELKKIEVRMQELQANQRTMDNQLRRTSSDSQRQAISERMIKERTELELLVRKRTILAARKSGNEESARKMQAEMQAQAKAEREKLRKELNGAFENLSIDAGEGVLEDLYPPFETIGRLSSVLNQKRRNYPLVLSDSILAKRMVVDSFAARASRGEISGFADTRILRLKLESLKSYFSMVGYFEIKMRELAELIEKDGEKKGLKTIIVIDFDDVKDELEKVRVNPFMLGYFLRMFRGLKTVSFVMTSSRQSITEDDSFDQHFTLVDMPPQEAGAVMENLHLFIKDYIEKKTSNGKPGIQISFEAMRAAVRLWEQYFSSYSAVEVLNRWFSGLALERRQKESRVAVELRDSLEQLKEELQDAAANEEVSEEDLLGIDEIKTLVRRVNASKGRMGERSSPAIGQDEALEFISELEARRGQVEIDTDSLKRDERANFLALEDNLKNRVVGQDDSLSTVSSVVRVAKAGLKPPKAPLGAFVFAGPTGVGKTQTAQTLADTLGMKMLRIDMSEYKTREDLSRLIGAPPGFVGYDEGEGYLFEHMKKYPKTVVVFDEIDKAAADVMNILLQVMEDGRLTSNRGDTVKFNESIIILTTNLGMKEIVMERGRPREISLYPEMEEAVKSGDPEKIKAFVEKMNVSVGNAVKRFFRPEFLNRLDGTLVFNPLPLDSLTKIVQLFLSETIERFRDKQGINLVVGRNDEEKASINKILAEKGYIAEYGARPMADAVKRHFENPLSSYMTQNIATIRRGDTITAKLEEGKIVFEHQKSEEAQEAEELDEQDRAAITGIAGRFKERPDEAVTIVDLEEIFGFRKEVEVGAGKRISETKLTTKHVLNDPDFRKKDKEANAARKEVVAKAPDEKKKALDNWIKEALRVEKRANFESFLYEKDRMVIKDYWESLPESLPGRLKEAQEAGKLVGLAAGQSDGGLCVAMGYNSGFSKFLQRHIFATKYENAEEIEKTAPRALQGFLKAKLELESLGIETNFDIEEGKTWFWVEVPVEEPAASGTEDSGAPGKTGDSLKNSYGEEALIRTRPGEEKTPGKSPAEPGSPTTVKCELEVSVIPRETGNFVMPFNVAVDKQGNIFVSNEGDWMSVVNSDKKALNQNFGKKGIISGKIERLMCVVIDDAGNIIGANWRRNFSVLNPDGKKLNRDFGNKGQVDYEPLGLRTPVDMVRDKEGNFLVVDARNESLTVLNPDLTLKTGFAASGTIPKETGKFSKPVGIALDNKGNIFVLNDGNGTISVLKPDGSLNAAFGNDGIIPLDFEDLGERKLLEVVKQGIGIDSKGNIYVIISNVEAMIVLNPDGKSRNPAFGDNGIINQLQGKFNNPRGLAIDKDDTVYVANAAEIGHISVLKFKKPEPSAPAPEEMPKLTGPLSTAQKVVDFGFKFSGRMLVGDIPFKVHPNGNLIVRDEENRIRFCSPYGVLLPITWRREEGIGNLPVLSGRIGQIAPGKKGKFEDTGEITFLEILPSGNILTRDSEGKVRLWDKNGVIIKDAFSIAKVEKQSWWAILWSGNITLAERGIEVLPDGNILTIDNDSAKLWDGAGNLLDALKVDKVIVGVYGATVFPDGEILTSDSDKHARVWTQYGKLRLDLSPGKLKTDMAYFGAARLDDGRYITFDKDGKQTVFNEDGEQTSPRLEEGISSKDGVRNNVVSTSSGWIFACGPEEQFVWDNNNECVRPMKFTIRRAPVPDGPYGIKGIKNLPNGNVLTYDSDNRVRIWTSDGELVASLKIEEPDIYEGDNYYEFLEPPIILPNGNILGRLKSKNGNFHAFLWTPDGEPINDALKAGNNVGYCKATLLGNSTIFTVQNDGKGSLWDMNGDFIMLINTGPNRECKHAELTPDGDLITLDNRDKIKRWRMTSTDDYQLFLRALATGDIANMPDMRIENFDANRLIKANAECIVDPVASIDKTDDLKEGDIIYFIDNSMLEYAFLVTKPMEDGKLAYKIIFARGPGKSVPLLGTEKESSIPEDQLRSGRVYRLMNREQFDETRSQALADLKRFITTGDMTAMSGIPQDANKLAKFIRNNAECVYKILVKENLNYLQVGDVIFTRDPDSEDYIISAISEILWPESMREPVLKVNIICRMPPGFKLRWLGNKLSEATIVAGDSRIAENGIYRIMTATEAALRGAADMPSAGPGDPVPEPIFNEAEYLVEIDKKLASDNPVERAAGIYALKWVRNREEVIKRLEKAYSAKDEESEKIAELRVTLAVACVVFDLNIEGRLREDLADRLQRFLPIGELLKFLNVTDSNPWFIAESAAKAIALRGIKSEDEERSLVATIFNAIEIDNRSIRNNAVLALGFLARKKQELLNGLKEEAAFALEQRRYSDLKWRAIGLRSAGEDISDIAEVLRKQNMEALQVPTETREALEAKDDEYARFFLQGMAPENQTSDVRQQTTDEFERFKLAVATGDEMSMRNAVLVGDNYARSDKTAAENNIGKFVSWLSSLGAERMADTRVTISPEEKFCDFSSLEPGDIIIWKDEDGAPTRRENDISGICVVGEIESPESLKVSDLCFLTGSRDFVPSHRRSRGVYSKQFPQSVVFRLMRNDEYDALKIFARLKQKAEDGTPDAQQRTTPQDESALDELKRAAAKANPLLIKEALDKGDKLLDQIRAVATVIGNPWGLARRDIIFDMDPSGKHEVLMVTEIKGSAADPQVFALILFPDRLSVLDMSDGMERVSIPGNVFRKFERKDFESGRYYFIMNENEARTLRGDAPAPTIPEATPGEPEPRSFEETANEAMKQALAQEESETPPEPSTPDIAPRTVVMDPEAFQQAVVNEDQAVLSRYLDDLPTRSALTLRVPVVNNLDGPVRYYDLQRGDILLVASPRDPKKVSLRRVISIKEADNGGWITFQTIYPEMGGAIERTTIYCQTRSNNNVWRVMRGEDYRMLKQEDLGEENTQWLVQVVGDHFIENDITPENISNPRHPGYGIAIEIGYRLEEYLRKAIVALLSSTSGVITVWDLDKIKLSYSMPQAARPRTEMPDDLDEEIRSMALNFARQALEAEGSDVDIVQKELEEKSTRGAAYMPDEYRRIELTYRQMTGMVRDTLGRALKDVNIAGLNLTSFEYRMRIAKYMDEKLKRAAEKGASIPGNLTEFFEGRQGDRFLYNEDGIPYCKVDGAYQLVEKLEGKAAADFLREFAGDTGASELTVLDVNGGPNGIERRMSIEDAIANATNYQLRWVKDKWVYMGGGYLPPSETPEDEALRDLTIPEKLAKCLRETALSLTFNKKIVLAFDTKVAAGSNEDPLGRLMEALRELKEDEAYAAILNNLVIVPADSKNMPTELAEHIADQNTEVFVFASTESRKDLRSIESRVHSSYIDHKEFHPDAYFPIAEVVVITLADYCESVLGETGIKNRLTIRNKTLNLDELNIESINKEDAKILVFKLLPSAKRYDKSRLIKSYATLRRLLIAA